MDVVHNLESVVSKYRAELIGLGPDPERGIRWNTDNMADAIADRIRKESQVRL